MQGLKVQASGLSDLDASGFSDLEFAVEPPVESSGSTVDGLGSSDAGMQGLRVEGLGMQELRVQA